MNMIKKTALLLVLACSSAQSTPRLIITSVPKSGTYLLTKTVHMLQRAVKKQQFSVDDHPKRLTHINEKSQMWIYHLHYNTHNLSVAKKTRLKILFICRDPRDQVASFVPFIRKHQDEYPDSWQHIHLIDPAIFSLPDSGLQRELILKINRYYDLFMPWRDHPQVYATRFEDLIGPKGGGSLEAQLREIINIGKHIGINVSRKLALKVANGLFGGTWTFRKGQIGAWNTEFTGENKHLFNEHAGQLLIELGYEKDLNW